MDWMTALSLDAIQWPAMGVTVLAAWLVASTSATRRKWGFWVFLLSNVLWVIWGLHAKAHALIVLQISLAAMNIRGARKNDKAQAEDVKAAATAP
jgi:hypothetical protein